MSSFKDLTGIKFGRLTVLGISGKLKPGRYLYNCVCDCEKQTQCIIRGSQLRSGITKSCGCLVSPGDQEFINKIKYRLKENSKWNGSCLEWIGKQFHHFGYGLISIKKIHKMAHRVSYEVNIGKIPDGMWVLHRCDNPKCINPSCLFLGTAKDNSSDMVSKGRQNNKAKGSPGEINPSAKLTKESVLKIIEMKKQGMSAKLLSDKFSVSISTINKITSGRAWIK